MDQWTETPSYINAITHLKRVGSHETWILPNGSHFIRKSYAIVSIPKERKANPFERERKIRFPFWKETKKRVRIRRNRKK